MDRSDSQSPGAYFILSSLLLKGELLTCRYTGITIQEGRRPPLREREVDAAMAESVLVTRNLTKKYGRPPW